MVKDRGFAAGARDVLDSLQSQPRGPRFARRQRSSQVLVVRPGYSLTNARAIFWEM